MKISTQNKKIFYNYNVLTKYQAGIVLTGSEVKSIKQNKCDISNAYVTNIKNEIFLYNMVIEKYSYSNTLNYNASRTRKLLLQKKEIEKISKHIVQKNLTAVPFKVFVNNKNYIKVEFFIVQGKKKQDKREYKKLQEWKKNKSIYSKY